MLSIGRSVLIVILLGLLWLAWQAPAPALAPPPARGGIRLHGDQAGADINAQPQGLWRVITRRLISQKAAKALGKRLQNINLQPIGIRQREPVTLHAFDDARRFNSWQDARAASAEWQKRKIETSVIRVEEGEYLLSLGRFYLDGYANAMRKRLNGLGRPYRYHRETVSIAVYRFTFPASPREQAQALWRQLQFSGLAMPVLMPAAQFRIAYGKAELYRINTGPEAAGEHRRPGSAIPEPPDEPAHQSDQTDNPHPAGQDSPPDDIEQRIPVAPAAADPQPSRQTVSDG